MPWSLISTSPFRCAIRRQGSRQVSGCCTTPFHFYTLINPFFKWTFYHVVPCIDNESFRLIAGPRARPTHWKQTVMYLEDTIAICEGEALTGTMSVAQNKKNPRDLDVTVTYNFNGKRSRASRTQHYRMR